MTGFATLPPDAGITSALVIGMAVTGRAVVDAFLRRGVHVVAADDRPSPAAALAAADRGVELVEAPTADDLARLLRSVDVVVPSPGVPRHHPVYALADELGVPVVSELDLAARWDDRPVVAITGTNGKTTVTSLVTSMLQRGGRHAVAAGNVDVPLVEAIDRAGDPAPEWFVVEASSFRLERVVDFAPRVGAWLNLAPDHLDWHHDLEQYAAAKARIWLNHGADDVKVVPHGDVVIGAHAERAGGSTVTFGIDGGDVRVAAGEIVVGGEAIVGVAEMPRTLPHDLLNATAAAAVVTSIGVGADAIRDELIAFTGLPHRMALVGTVAGVAYYDDSKATTPEATIAGVGGFERAVLIAGGRNKGLDLGGLAVLAPRLAGVVAIGEAGPAVAAAYAGTVPVDEATSMADAVELAAARAAATGAGAVVLSPACASFDWYANYAERGDDFARVVARLEENGGTR